MSRYCEKNDVFCFFFLVLVLDVTESTADGNSTALLTSGDATAEDSVAAADDDIVECRYCIVGYYGTVKLIHIHLFN